MFETIKAQSPYWQWTTFHRGFDSPTSYTEAVKAGLRLPKCDVCEDFPEQISIGVLIRPWADVYTGNIINHERIDIEVRIECHGKRWSFNGQQAQQYLDGITGTA